MAGKTIVILGGGVGGLVTANELRGRLGKEHRVILVDREDRHILPGLRCCGFRWGCAILTRSSETWRG